MKNILFITQLFLLSNTFLLANEIKSTDLKAVANDLLLEPFAIDYQDIKILNRIITDRINEELDSSYICYRVCFSNNYYYDTDKIDDILSEENPSTNKISSIDIYAGSYKLPKFSVSSTGVKNDVILPKLPTQLSSEIRLQISEKGFSYSINGKRDWVLNTKLSILERHEEILSNVDFLTRYKIYIKIIIVILYINLVFWLCVRVNRWNYYRKVGKTNSVTLYDYAFRLNEKHLSHLDFTIYIAIASCLIFFIFRNVIDIFTPEHVFLIGDQINDYKEVSLTIKSLIIGIVSSIIAGYFFTLKRVRLESK